MDPRQSEQKRPAFDTQDFTAVILVGAGENLFPFNEGANVLPKALMPVGNKPIINIVLDWVFAAGLTDVLVIVPPSAAAPISEYLSEYLQLEYSSSSQQREPRITLRTYDDGEDDEEDLDVTDKTGTARLLKRFRSDIKASTDFVLLPCDISFPSTLTLASILDKHRATPNAVLTSVFYEPPESVRESEEKMIVATDKTSDELLLVQPLEALENSDFELRMGLISSHPTLSLSTRLLDAHVYVFRRTVLDLIATRRSKDLTSVREQFVPWLLKGAWQDGLAHKWAPILNPPRRDPFAAALARSTATSYREAQTLVQPSAPSSALSEATPLPSTTGQTEGQSLVAFKEAVARSGKSVRHKRNQPAGWTCRVVVVRPEAPPAEEPVKGGKGGKAKAAAGPEPEYIVRANNIAGYWEINRNMVRTLGAANAAAASRDKAAGAAPGGAAGTGASTPGQTTPGAEEIATSAQISPDSLVGEGVRVGDRASIKKCIVGRHCVIGKNAKLTGCVLWDFVTVEEGARIENAILCPNVRIGEKAQIKDCEFGPGFEAKPGAVLKGERLVAGQEA